MDDFYVYLPSNVRSIYFENTSANFKTKLAKYCTLNELYEVGLAEISYTYSFSNIFDNENIEICYLNSDYIKIRKKVKLKKGYYTIEELLASLNNIIQIKDSFISLPKFELYNDRKIQKVKLIFGETENAPIFVKISDNLERILGISKNDLDEISDRLLTYIINDYQYTRILKSLQNLIFGLYHQ